MPALAMLTWRSAHTHTHTHAHIAEHAVSDRVLVGLPVFSIGVCPSCKSLFDAACVAAALSQFAHYAHLAHKALAFQHQSYAHICTCTVSELPQAVAL